jgi:hypothetical protein
MSARIAAMTTVKGTFEITMQAEPPFDEVGGVTLSRASFDKRLSGPLEATSKVHMLASRTPVDSYTLEYTFDGK